MPEDHFLKDAFHRPDGYGPFMNRLRRLFADMDREYEAVAGRYGFQCRGCEDNCCLTRFHHHTVAECLYMWEGFQGLPATHRQALRRRSETVIQKTAAAEEAGGPVRVMCPVNQDGLCRLYSHRPMICRLHGIAHELHRPDGRRVQGPGCDRFTQAAQNRPCLPFDRTPFYARMARLEKALRETLGVAERVRMTVAEMIRSFPANPSPPQRS